MSVSYSLKTREVVTPLSNSSGKAWEVGLSNFPVLSGVTVFTIEFYDDSMRLPHWHPNCSELGYLLSGKLEIFLWRYTGEASKYTVTPGQCWFIPQGALHALINVSDVTAKMVIGFNTTAVQNIDLPVAFNGIPVPLRNAFTSPHSTLKDYKGTTVNPLFGVSPLKEVVKEEINSPYLIDMSRIAPLYNGQYGNVTWAIKDNWNILNDISIIRVILKPNTARDPIWYPDAGTLYVVTKGKATFKLIFPLPTGEYEFDASEYDYIYVPVGILHTFWNTTDKDFEVVGYFTKDNPLPEVSLLLSTGFFPLSIGDYGLVRYAGSTINPNSEPLVDLKKPLTTPYILSIGKIKGVVNGFLRYFNGSLFGSRVLPAKRTNPKSTIFKGKNPVDNNNDTSGKGLSLVKKPTASKSSFEVFQKVCNTPTGT